MDSLTALKKAKSVEDIFAALLPGASPATSLLRDQAAALSMDLLARGAIIIGAPGTGKSTLARAIGLARWANLLKPEALPSFLKGIQFDGPARLATLQMEWYRELSLTGLVGDLADSQLFGILRGAATDVKASRDGLFRLAMQGIASQEKQDPTPAATATGGVVFLDEIGDVPPELQPKLLTVVTGSPVYPVGGEGDSRHVYVFSGLTVGATWLDLDVVRQDLLARLSDHVIRVPPLSERIADLPILIDTIAAEMRRALEDKHKTIRGTKIQGDRIDNARFPDTAPPFSINEEDRKRLEAVDWALHGDLRGLTQVIRTAYGLGIPIADAIARHRVIPIAAASRVSIAEELIERILDSSPTKTLLSAVGNVEGDSREEMVSLLKKRPDLVTRLAEHLNVDAGRIRREYTDVTRSRRNT